jgi:hypothetical protein
MWVLSHALMFWGFDASSFSASIWALRTRHGLPNAVWDPECKSRDQSFTMWFVRWLQWPMDLVHPYLEREGRRLSSR